MLGVKHFYLNDDGSLRGWYKDQKRKIGDTMVMGPEDDSDDYAASEWGGFSYYPDEESAMMHMSGSMYDDPAWELFDGGKGAFVEVEPIGEDDDVPDDYDAADELNSPQLKLNRIIREVSQEDLKNYFENRAMNEGMSGRY
jgi:hypothetical protein